MHTHTSTRAHVHTGTATSGAEAGKHREPSAMFLPQTEVPLPQAIGLCASVAKTWAAARALKSSFGK